MILRYKYTEKTLVIMYKMLYLQNTNEPHNPFSRPMKVTKETLAAISCVAKRFIYADGSFSQEEFEPLYHFFESFEGMSADLMQSIIQKGNDMDLAIALKLIMEMDPDAKQQLSNLFAKILCADQKLTEDEKDTFFKVQELCELPDPEMEDAPEEEPAAQEPEEEEEDAIAPAFLIVNFYGIATVKQSSHEDWDVLGRELASWINTDRVEIVRFTAPLNQLSQELRLNLRHLVFMVARNHPGTVGDNMPGTLLYGGGYPIYGDIAIALETDGDYTVEGIRSRHLLTEIFSAVNRAVGNLIRVE